MVAVLPMYHTNTGHVTPGSPLTKIIVSNQLAIYSLKCTTFTATKKHLTMIFAKIEQLPLIARELEKE